MKPASKRRSKRAEESESDEDAPLTASRDSIYSDNSGDEGSANINKSSNRRGGKKSTENASDASDEGSKQGNDRRRSEKRQKYNKTEDEEGKEASDLSESDADKETTKPTKRGRHPKEKTPQKEKASGSSSDRRSLKRNGKNAADSDAVNNESNKRKSGKKIKPNETEPEDQDKQDDKADSDDSEIQEEESAQKETKTPKEKTPKAGKGKRGRKPKKAPDDDEPTNGTAAQDNTDYEVEDIIEQRIKFGKLQYLIRWKGYEVKDDTWERADGLNCRDIIKRYKQRVKEERDAESSADEKTEEFEVNKIKEVHFRRDGSREFLVGWKGFTTKDDTWEHESNMKCPELIAQFMRRVDQAKGVTLRQLREHREPTKHYTANSFDVFGRRLSSRSRNKPRVNYFYDDQY